MMRVLVADDSRAMRKLLRGILEGMGGGGGVEVFEAADGAEVARTLAEVRPEIDFIVADWELSGLDGPSFLRHLAASGAAGEAPVLFCINGGQSARMEEARRIRPCEFIERPFTDEDFRKKVRDIGVAVEERKDREASDVLKAIVSTAETAVELPFLLRLPSEAIDEFLRLAERHRAPAGAALLDEGSPVDAFYVVVAGTVEVKDSARPRGPKVCGEGECFAEVAFLMEVPSTVSVRAKTDVEVAALPRPMLAELVRHHPRVGDVLGTLLAEKAKTAAPSTRLISNTDFSGSLQSMSFSDVVQLLNLSRKTGTLTLNAGVRSGGVCFVEGEIRHAWTESLLGEDAFYEMAGWRKAVFAFAGGPGTDQTSVRQPTMSLLMEAMRRLDERGRVASTPSPAGRGTP
jgi:two-component system chemotaxis response regulator CheY